jgi:chemotaxis protein MotA
VEITSVVGPILGLVTVFLTAHLKHLPPQALFTAAGNTIIFLGTASTLIVGYTLKDIKFCLGSMKLYLKGPQVDGAALVEAVEKLAALARKDGFLALEKEIEKLEDPFLAKGVRMLVDNTEPHTIQEILESEIELKFEEEELAAKFFEDMGAFAPTVGIIGAVLGLMAVMANLDKPDQIGPGIQAAFTATVWGVAVANLFALPAGKKLKRMCQIVKLHREVAMIGVLGIAHSHAPKVLVERLRNMLELEHE